MAGNTKTCNQCGVSVPAAMVRCRDCGRRFDAPARQTSESQATGTRTSGVYRAAAENRRDQPEQRALSLEDMLSVAEDAETGASSVFNISRTLKTDGKLQPEAKPQSTRNPVEPNQKPSQESTIDESPAQEPLSISEIYQSPVAQNENPQNFKKPQSTPQDEQNNRASQKSSVVMKQSDTDVTPPLESPSGLRRTREKRRKDAASNYPLTLVAIKKAIKQSPPEIQELSGEESSSKPNTKKATHRRKHRRKFSKLFVRHWSPTTMNMAGPPLIKCAMPWKIWVQLVVKKRFRF